MRYAQDLQGFVLRHRAPGEEVPRELNGRELLRQGHQTSQGPGKKEASCTTRVIWASYSYSDRSRAAAATFFSFIHWVWRNLFSAGSLIVPFNHSVYHSPKQTEVFSTVKINVSTCWGVINLISGVPDFMSGVPGFLSGVPGFLSGVPGFISAESPAL